MKPNPYTNPQQRENDEPEEGDGPWPWYVTGLVVFLMAFGVVYLSRTSITNPPAMGDGRAVAELQAPEAAPAGAGVDGAAVFGARCAACHQATGAGLPGVFPPLVGSEWVVGDETTLVAAVLHGISGQLTVKGQVYAGVMPSFQAQLSDAELAAVLSHVRSTWGNQAKPIAAALVAGVRKATAERKESFKGDDELHQFKLAP